MLSVCLTVDYVLLGYAENIALVTINLLCLDLPSRESPFGVAHLNGSNAIRLNYMLVSSFEGFDFGCSIHTHTRYCSSKSI